MLSIVLIWLLGLGLIYAEFFFPGGILAALGAMALIVAGADAVKYLGVDWGLLAALVLGLISIGLTVKLALWHISFAQQGRVVLNTTQEGYTAASFDHTLVGLQAAAASDLRPVGYILIGEQRLVATAQGEFIAKGENVKIIGGEGSSFTVVRQISQR